MSGNNNNNNNNNNNIVILPNYIQKYIIKLLCNFINKNNKLVDLIGNSQDEYRNNEQVIKKLMLSLSLVSKLWFNTMQTHLTVCVDFNYILNSSDDTNTDTDTSKSTSIIKIENIKTLKLHYNNKQPWFYKKSGGQDGQEFEIKLEYINQQLKLLSNLSLKKLILRNINIEDIISSSTNLLKINELESLYKCNVIENGNITIQEYLINQDTTIELISDIVKKISKVISIIISSCYDINVLEKAFNNWYKSITSIYINNYNEFEQTQQDDDDGGEDGEDSEAFSIYKFLTSKESNGIYLSNIKFIQIYNSEITLSQIVSLLKHANNLTHLYIDICYNNLFYFLSNKNERLKFGLKRCWCSSVLKRNLEEEVEEDIPEEEVEEVKEEEVQEEVKEEEKKSEDNEDLQKEFDENWLLFKNLLIGGESGGPKILNLDFNNHCTHLGDEIWLDDESGYPESFIENISNLIIACTNLVKFSMSGTTPEIFKKIIEKNKSIVYFETILVGCKDEENINNFKDNIELLINQNNHIREFLITHFQFSEENSSFSQKEILNYNINKK